jgi:hypothetical protein
VHTLQRLRVAGQALLGVDRADNAATVTGRARQTATVIAVITAGVAGLIGIFIFSQVNNSLPAIQNNNTSNSKVVLVDGFGNAMELLPVVLIVLLAALVITTVTRVQS